MIEKLGRQHKRKFKTDSILHSLPRYDSYNESFIFANKSFITINDIKNQIVFNRTTQKIPNVQENIKVAGGFHCGFTVFYLTIREKNAKGIVIMTQTKTQI